MHCFEAISFEALLTGGLRVNFGAVHKETHNKADLVAESSVYFDL